MTQLQTPFLLTGVTGGLGAKILSDLLTKHSIPPTSIITTSRSPHHRKTYEAQSLQFRLADYDAPTTLTTAFTNVHNLLFISSSERDTTRRNTQHQNVISAAIQAKVGKVWYISLAFGGYSDGSKIGFQQAHYETERLLSLSGLDFVTVRAGVYADAFPLFLNWYPSSTKVLLPVVQPGVQGGRVAFASREELGEGIAVLLARGLEAFPGIRARTEKNIVLLSGSEGESLVDLVGAVERGRGTGVGVEYLQPEEWIDECARDDEGGKGRAWFEARLVFMQGICNGDAELIDPALEILLGRKPETGTQTVERLVREDPQYTWHQNHVNRK